MPRGDRSHAPPWLGWAVLLLGALRAPFAPAGSPPPQHRHEESDVHVGGVLASTAGLVVALGLAIVGASWLYASLTHPAVSLSPREPVPATPRTSSGTGAEATSPVALRPDPAAETAAVRQREREMLNSYGWVDRQAGVVRIPIERAMDLTAQRGLPARPATPPPPLVASGAASGRFVAGGIWP